MRIDELSTDDAVLAELGERLARARLERDITQKQLADAAGVSRSALQHIEAGRPASTTNLVRFLRALEMLDALERAIPERPVSPIAELRRSRPARRRASGSRVRAEPEGSGWRWGEGAPRP